MIGINADVQFCTAEKPKFSKHVLVLNTINGLADVVSVNENSCVQRYKHMLYCMHLLTDL